MVISLNDHIDRIDIFNTLPLVSDQRRKEALRYRNDSDRRLSLAVYLLLRKALEEGYGIEGFPEFAFGPHGKPVLKDRPEIHFNLSHCRLAALCVVNDAPVGCDVECVPSSLEMEVCRYCFNEEEISGILSSENPPLAFTALWTKKEAFLKLTGEGLTDHLPMLLRKPQIANVSFQTHTAPDNSYVYTVCHFTPE